MQSATHTPPSSPQLWSRDQSSVSLASLIHTRGRVGLPIAPEAALFVSLDLLRMARAAGLSALDAGNVRVLENGTLELTEGSGVRRAGNEGIRDDVLRVLQQLLLRARPPLSTAAVNLADPDTAPRDLDALEHGLRAALVPLNEEAARRVLARLRRETLSASLPAPIDVAPFDPDPDALDREFDLLMKGDASGPSIGQALPETWQPPRPIIEPIPPKELALAEAEQRKPSWWFIGLLSAVFAGLVGTLIWLWA